MKLTVVLVGDFIDETSSMKEQSVFDWDNPDAEEVAAIEGWLHEAGFQVIVRDSVRSFIDSPPTTGNCIVFPLWRGGSSRNRTAVVPAICEERGLSYVGGDAFVQCVCQNKSLSKIWARAAGFNVPRDLTLYSPEDAESCNPISHLRSPCVVKPLSSACSIGITDDSLCSNDDEATAQVKLLFEDNLGPVMCEEFVSGEEVSLCIIEEEGKIALMCLVGYKNAKGMCPFHDGLFTFNNKIDEGPDWNLEVKTMPNDNNLIDSAENLMRWLGRVDCLRIDGRMRNGRFVLVELTPDIHMAISTSFLGGFNAQGFSPSKLLEKLIRASLLNQKSDLIKLLP